MNKLYLLLLILANTHSAFSQQATNTANGTGQAGNIIMDWSLGELTLVNTAQYGNLMLTQGFHQGKLMPFVTSTTLADGELIVTPNPTPALLSIQSGFLQAGQLLLKLYDAQGKLLLESNETISGFNTQKVNMLPYASGLYLLHAVFTPVNGDARKRTYKILRLP